jgi:predicted nucleic acid-binding protein
VIIVVDANVVISALVAKGVSYRVFLLNFLLDKFDFIAPEFLWREVEKHKAMLLEETKLSSDEFDEILDFLKEEIVIVPAKDFIRWVCSSVRSILANTTLWCLRRNNLRHLGVPCSNEGHYAYSIQLVSFLGVQAYS